VIFWNVVIISFFLITIRKIYDLRLGFFLVFYCLKQYNHCFQGQNLNLVFLHNVLIKKRVLGLLLISNQTRRDQFE